ncbi:MAG TPA: hypothetical protein VK555_06525 [Terriglobales bacterium]|nr:hypothetical protein [Terriglobales bacterium]
MRKDVIAEVRQAAKEEEQNRADCCHFASRRNCRQAAKVCDVEILRRYDVRRVEGRGMGKFMGYGIAIGVGIGTAIGAATDDIGTWKRASLAIGGAIGYGMTRAKKKPD